MTTALICDKVILDLSICNFITKLKYILPKVSRVNLNVKLEFFSKPIRGSIRL